MLSDHGRPAFQKQSLDYALTTLRDELGCWRSPPPTANTPNPDLNNTLMAGLILLGLPLDEKYSSLFSVLFPLSP